ncbi:MAG: Gldg family protein [Alphaproteobacteria bacterium]
MMKKIFHNRRLVVLVSIALAAALFVSANLISNIVFRAASVDLTADRLFTLSGGTRTVLSGVTEPLSIRFYYSTKLGQVAPAYRAYANRVQELLERYAQLSNNNIRLEILDPTPFSETEDQAVSFGLQGVPINQQGEAVYFGLVATNRADDLESIPFFQLERERFLEYDLTRLVYTLSNPKKKTIGMINSTLPIDGRTMRGPATPPWLVLENLTRLFQVKDLGFDPAEIPADIDALVLIHPKPGAFAEKTQYAIDQYVLNGGRVLVFVDPHAETDPGGAGAGAQYGGSRSELPKLFDAWGIAYNVRDVATDLRYARRVNIGQEGRVQIAEYVAWMTLQGDRINRDDVATADVASVNIQTGGVIAPKEGATTTFTPLLRTSADAMVIDSFKVRREQPDFASLLREYKPGGKELVVAARVRGPAKTAFPDGPPADEKKDGEKKDEAAKSARPHRAEGNVNIVVVADTDLMQDRAWAQVQSVGGQNLAVPFAGNGEFVINLIDNLAGSDALIGLRSRGQSLKPFVRVQDLEFQAEQRFRNTERNLQAKLEQVQTQLKDLQTQRDQGGQVILSENQREAIEKFQTEIIDTRRQLREVQHALRRDIDVLKGWLEFVNIGLIPSGVGVAALVVGGVRIHRRRRRDQRE